MNNSVSIITRGDLLRRIRCEYLEMPGLRLTRPQAQRLWGLDEQTCAQVLDSLMEARFLQRRDDGTYARLTDGEVAFPLLRMAKAGQAGPSASSLRVAASGHER